MDRIIIHLILHFFIPFAVAKSIWREKWIRPFLIMTLTIAIDLDHFFSDPFFDPNRCSIGSHPLHSWPAIGFYLAFLFIPYLRIAALGLLIHMALDGTDCLWLI